MKYSGFILIWTYTSDFKSKPKVRCINSLRLDIWLEYTQRLPCSVLHTLLEQSFIHFYSLLLDKTFPHLLEKADCGEALWGFFVNN